MAAKKKRLFLNKTKIFLFAFAIVGLALFVLVLSIKRESPALACTPKDFSGLVENNQTAAFYEGQEIRAPLLAEKEVAANVLGTQNSDNKWVEIDLSEQKLKAWDGGQLFLETPISSGLPWTPTPIGEFTIWAKLRATKMEGGEGKYYYNLPNVPYVMFLENDKVPGWKGYGLHGTYWHNDFGKPHSHGCVNLPTSIAEKLYYWVTPGIPEKKTSVFASPDNMGTKVIIHD